LSSTTNPSVFSTNYFNEKQTTTTTTPISKEYYNWQEIYPELKILLDNINDLITESETISTWVPLKIIIQLVQMDSNGLIVQNALEMDVMTLHVLIKMIFYLV